MTEAPNRYEKGKIYKLVCNTTGEIYIGSTIRSLKVRLRYHKNCFEESKQGKCCRGKISAFQIIERQNYKIELVENYPCTSLEELRKREQYYFDILECINVVRPYRSKEDDVKARREANRREDRIQYKKEWYEKNKERIQRQRQEKYNDNLEQNREKERGRYHNNKEYFKQKHKEYRDKHIDEAKAYSKEYRKNNHEIIKQKQKEYWKKNKEALNQRRREAYEKNKK